MYDIDKDNWEKFLDIAENEANQNTKSELISWFGCSQNSTNLKTFLNRMIKNRYDFNVADVVKSVIEGSPIGFQVAFDFVLANINQLKQL